ncbi:hypothetical protein N9N24_04685 [Candidatus Marinimicrobia bacterium]|nr:hypothetical protein [Candidatus Neomarinimicrobiota bacterium]
MQQNKENEQIQEINENKLIVLKKNPLAIDYIDIKKYFINELLILEQLCSAPEPNLDELLEFLKKTDSFKALNGNYRYCKSLQATYVEFTTSYEGSCQDLMVEIHNNNQLLKSANSDVTIEKKEEYLVAIEKNIKVSKESLYNKYKLWTDAYSIRKAYETCKLDENIIIHSHRTSGWSNPVYQLTPNFSVEVLTNFGYGGSSYFYTKLKYKNIDITPFSDWIKYRIVQASELLRYSKKHPLSNQYWFEAIEFSKEACNLSLSDERKFVEKYIVEECEIMASGLEEFFIKKSFNLYEGDKNIELGLDGHALIDFRGEKITGALDFISKIIEFDKVASIQTFIERIEKINKKLEPILEAEVPKVKMTIEELNQEKDELEPKRNEMVNEFNIYQKKMDKLKIQKKIDGEFDPSSNESRKEFFNIFKEKHPNYERFMHKYNQVNRYFIELESKIIINIQILEKIESYKQRVQEYFREK